MKSVKSLFLCLFLASSLSYGEQVLRIMGPENLTEEEKELVIKAGHTVLGYIKKQKERETNHPFAAAFGRTEFYGTSEIEKMKGIYKEPPLVKLATETNEGIAIKWNGYQSGFSDMNISGIKIPEWKKGTIKLVVRRAEIGQIDTSQEEFESLYKEMGLLSVDDFKRKAEIRYFSPFSGEPNFNVLHSSPYGGMDEKVVEMIKSGSYEGAGYIMEIDKEAEEVSALLNGKVDALQPKTIYLQFASEPLGGGGGAPPRKGAFLSFEPLGGGGGAPRKDGLVSFSHPEVTLQEADDRHSFQIEISTGYSFDELEGGDMEWNDGSTVLLIVPFQNY